MKVLYICPAWGQEKSSVCDLLERVINEGYDGIEMNVPEDDEYLKHFFARLDFIRESIKPDFVFVAQQVLPPATESANDYRKRMAKRLRVLAELKPDFINSHTGKDYYSFDDNCRIIEEACNISSATGVPILHETHRGRFSFQLSTIVEYLDKFPEMELVGDFSHWCTVSESLLQDQLCSVDRVIPHVTHIHARVGFEQGPQVNDPFAPEWHHHLETFVGWWKRIIEARYRKRCPVTTVTPEAGPPPYMPLQPFTCEPLGDQWSINSKMKELLDKKLAPQPQTIL